MKFTKVENGKYKFKGIDSWNGKEIEGTIIDQPFDKKLSQRWEIRFKDAATAENMFPTLKAAKAWLTE